MWPEDCLAKSSDGSCYSAQIVNQVLHKSRFRFRTNPNQIFEKSYIRAKWCFAMAWGPPGLAAWCRRHPESERHNFPITPRTGLSCAFNFSPARTNFFSVLCVCVGVIGSSQILQSFVMQILCCLVCHTTAAQTIWINLFFYVSHTGTTVAACRWAASSRSWVYAAEQLHFFTSAITVFQEILSW